MRSSLGDGVRLCIKKKKIQRQGVVAHACNPSTLEAKVADHQSLGVQDQPDQHGETPPEKKNSEDISGSYNFRVKTMSLNLLPC